jgi:hypothetical protein
VPRFFFHVRDGYTSLDIEGIELADCDAARRQAIEAMGEILKDEGRQHWTADVWAMHVMDEFGDTICRLRFQADAQHLKKCKPFEVGFLL